MGYFVEEIRLEPLSRKAFIFHSIPKNCLSQCNKLYTLLSVGKSIENLYYKDYKEYPTCF